MNKMELYESVRNVPQEAQKEIKGGRMSGKTDINPMWRIKALTEQFGPCGIGWYYKTTNKWIERFENTIAAFVDIELFVKYEDQWSMPISGTGGSMFVAIEKCGPFVSDECYKMATTDAISVSCKQLGIGADVYWGADKTKYTGNDTTGKPDGKPAEDLPNKNFAKHDALVAEFEKEIARTGKSFKYFLTMAKTTEAKYIKTDQLNQFIAMLKVQPDKEVA